MFTTWQAGSGTLFFRTFACWEIPSPEDPAARELKIPPLAADMARRRGGQYKHLARSRTAWKAHQRRENGGKNDGLELVGSRKRNRWYIEKRKIKSLRSGRERASRARRKELFYSFLFLVIIKKGRKNGDKMNAQTGTR